MGYSVWVVLDWLDEAFQGFPEAEVPALRALLRTYLDLSEFDRIKLKLFVRKDLFRRIIEGGFVNLTHVNAGRSRSSGMRRTCSTCCAAHPRERGVHQGAWRLARHAGRGPLQRGLPRQVDQGTRRPTTWNWMLARIRDGNGIAPPRNLIDLVQKAQEAQQRKEQRTPTEYEPGNDDGVIQSDAIKRGLAALSKERVEDTLLAEAGGYARLIERFSDGRAEHNDETLAQTLAVPIEAVRAEVKLLVELGFLEQTGETYKVPMLYRGGLSITQGKAFAPTRSPPRRTRRSGPPSRDGSAAEPRPAPARSVRVPRRARVAGAGIQTAARCQDGKAAHTCRQPCRYSPHGNPSDPGTLSVRHDDQRRRLREQRERLKRLRPQLQGSLPRPERSGLRLRGRLRQRAEVHRHGHRRRR